MTIEISVNGARHQLNVEADMPLLWVLRDELGLTGTKFGCGVSACGACTVHVDGVAIRSCTTTIGDVAGASITTIEGLGGEEAHPVQLAWIKQQVPQCGYCQSGMIMAVAAMLADNPNPTREDLDETITNICRCGTYERIRAAVDDLAQA